MDLHRIELILPKRGYDRFYSSWLLHDKEKDISLLVDPGPASTWPQLRDALRRIGMVWINMILLTHVHIDHAGAAGLASNEFGARVAVSPRGIPHLIDPSRLWEASLKTLGEIAVLFGEPAPVPPDCIMPEELLSDGLSFVDTPGHASHHRSYYYDDGEEVVLFVGEAAGVYLEGELPYPCLRPAAPPPFFIDAALESIEKLTRRECSRICFPHFGSAEGGAELLAYAKDQVLLWKDIVLGLLRRGVAPEDYEAFAAEILDRDPFMAAFQNMDPGTLDRERDFLLNSVRGFTEALVKER
ncbi:MAG: MBL fold metallo-hydrolase [Synergistaceae bacterium]|nr:MBL fold metallo-hydrolase [Synergistota bacterium]NLM70780.1 MBL fold metallo-hydrolase [Synergistaceae bacterium]